MLFVTYSFLFAFAFAVDYECSLGCHGSCIANYTCAVCEGTYLDGDNSCTYCPIFDPYEPVSSTNVLYHREDDFCYQIDGSQIIDKISWAPDVVESISLNQEISLSFDDNTMYDSGPCISRDQTGNHYERSHWLEFNAAEVTEEVGILAIYLKFEDDLLRQQINIDLSTSTRDKSIPNCYGRHVLLESVNETNFEFQIKKENTDYQPVFIYIDSPGLTNFNFTFQIVELMESSFHIDYYISAEDANEMMESGEEIIYEFEIASDGIGGFSNCIPGHHLKASLFNIELQGNFRFVVDSRISHRMLYLGEYSIDENGNVLCDNLWDGEIYGVLSHRGKDDGFLAMIQATEKTLHKFAILSFEFDLNFNISFQAICPDDCNSASGQGACSKNNKGCICEDGYGADNCRKLCYYNGEFTVNNSDERCVFGSHACDDDCYCETNHSVENHLCVSQDCFNGDMSGDLECKRGVPGCLGNCYCNSTLGINHLDYCDLYTCGNGIVDEGEECDGGVNCHKRCECYEGYTQDKDDPRKCSKQTMNLGLVIGVSIAGVILFFLMFVAMAVFVVILSRRRKIDFDEYKTQQDPYYLYLSGSMKVSGGEKQSLTPTDLDFGNEFSPTEINDTRFQRIEIKNKSRNKWILVMVHPPLSPKFVFHFEPEFVFVRPQRTGLLTSYLTLFCTTKIKDMKIPYTIWVSYSKKTLESIPEILKNKSFETWGDDDEHQMQKNLRNIIKHYHGNFIVKTESVSSTFIDMDELNIGDEPIAEGAMGRVFVGSYRSVPVAIKQFRWENLTEEETEELKENVIEECLLFRKLRNPFVANYMGAVTYLPQVSMVIQFFVLGSLGEYLRKDSKYYFELPYNLKLKMLYDTSRGMEFLHENKILHLDMKPDNLLVNSFYADSACCVKITDFGTSRLVKKGSLDDKGLGTPIYVAPEAYEDIYTNASDVYSFGVTAWEIYHQKEPYEDFKSLFEIKDYVKSGKRLEFDDTVKESFKLLTSKCWNQDPEQRPTFDEITKELVKMVDHYSRESNQPINLDQIEEFARQRTERLNNLLGM